VGYNSRHPAGLFCQSTGRTVPWRRGLPFWPSSSAR